MKTLLFFPLVLLACNQTGKLTIGGGSETGGDTDTDTDADSDTDVDTADTGEPPDVAETPPDEVVDCKGGPGTFATIQEAIDAAVSPARIGVKACTYTERIDMLGKIIDLYGIDGSAKTILQGDGGGTVVDFEMIESGWSRFAGFTVTGGVDDADGAAMELTRSSVELDDVIFTGNEGLNIVRGADASVDMQDVVFRDNTVLSTGQAVRMDGGNVNMVNTTIDCDGGAQALWHHVQALIVDSTITCDTGYGVLDYHGEDRILRSTIWGATSGYYAYDNASTPEEPDSPSERFFVENSVIGGGNIGAEVKYMHLELANSVFYGGASAVAMTECDSGSWSINNVYAHAACGITGDQPFSDQNSSFWVNTSDGCGITVTPAVSMDPEFTHWPDDLTLQAGSPLIDAGYGAWTDTDGSRSDIGRYGGPRGGW